MPAPSPQRDQPPGPPSLAIVHRRRIRRSPLALWHLLSLDAPSVATLWTWFVARCAGVPLPRAALLSMFVTVWILYAADRLLDARVLDSPSSQAHSQIEERHRFHHRHKRAFLSAIGICSIALAVMLPRLLPEALRLYALLAALLVAYFLLIHTRISAERRLPKELAVGIFFPAAVFIPTIARRPDLRLTLLPYALAFAAVCTLNCLFLYAWEHADHAGAHWTTRFATRHLRTIAAAIIVLSLVLSIPSAANRGIHPSALALPCAASTLLLVLFHRYRRRILPVHLRAAADLTLLTPIAFAVFVRP